MKDNLLYFKINGIQILGHVILDLPQLKEIWLLAPFYGFFLKDEVDDNAECNIDQSYDWQQLVEKAYSICKIIQDNHKTVRADFIILLDTLEKFNNTHSVDYKRNREELMKIFLKTHFTVFNHHSEKSQNLSTGIFNFLCMYFVQNGKCAELDIRTQILPRLEPPKFSSLESELKSYLTLSEYERIELLTEQIILNIPGKFSWFTEQEFLQINQGNTKTQNL